MAITVTDFFRVDPRVAGTGRRLLVQTDGKRPRGRPQLPHVMRRDQLLGHVLQLECMEPRRKKESIVAEVAAFHRVSRATVYAALAGHDQDKPIDGGFCRFVWTYRSRAAN